MTAAQIVEIVGTERKAWWPSSIHWDGNAGCFVQNLSSRPDLHPSFSTVLDDDITELAFIGAAVVELLKRAQVPSLWRGNHGEEGYRVENALYGKELGCGPTILHALVAALKESEAP